MSAVDLLNEFTDRGSKPLSVDGGTVRPGDVP